VKYYRQSKQDYPQIKMFSIPKDRSYAHVDFPFFYLVSFHFGIYFQFIEKQQFSLSAIFVYLLTLWNKVG